MCGICGIVSEPDGPPVNRTLLTEMTDVLAHRGPDGRGVYVNDRAGLGHRRLSIIDLNTGDQPIYNEDGTIAIVFNGEIYNYRELQTEIRARGHTLATQSDTEVIVHLYEDFGDDCVKHLNGMFAFALWDSRRGRLLAARDRFGEKPLYYCHRDGRLTFASELKSLLLDASLPRDLEHRAIDDLLAYGYIPAPRTIYREVIKLRPAHRLIFESGRVRVEPYWQIDVAGDGDESEQAYVEELRELLIDSVRLRLRADVPVGAFLSGGIDSNGIVAVAAQQLDRPLQTYSVGFREAEFDELRLARQTAKRYGTDHREIVVDDGDMSVFEDLVRHFDEPFADPSMLPTYFITREASKYVKVCISGDGGDEVFAGYTHYVDAKRYAHLDVIPALVRRSILGGAAAILPNGAPGKGLMRRLTASGSARYQRQIGVFDAVERRRLLDTAVVPVDSSAELFEAHFSRNGRDLVSTLQHVDQHTYLPDDILVKVDRAAMKNSLEVRVPYLDHRLVELVNRMPSSVKIRGRQQKHVLRRALERDLSAEVLNGAKRGFGIPIRHWFRGELRAYAQAMLLSNDSRSARFVRRPAVKKLLSHHEHGGRDLSDRIWALLVLEQWCRCFNV